MPQIQSREEAQAVIQLIEGGQLSEPAKAQAMADLNAFADAESQIPATAPGNPRGAVMKQIGRTAGAGIGRILAGPGQLVSAAADLVVPGTLENYNQATEELLEQVRGTPYKGSEGWLLERGTELLGGAAASPTSKARGLAGIVKSAAQSSALAATTAYDPEASSVAEKASSTMLGTVAGVGLAGTLNGLGFVIKNVPNIIVKFVNRTTDPEQQAAAQRLVEQFPKLRDMLTISQQRGSVGGAKLESQVAGNYALKNYREISNTLKDELSEYGDRYGARWNPQELAAQAGPRGQMAMRKAVSELAAIKNAEWNAAMDAAEVAITSERIASRGVTGARQTVLPVQDLETRLLELTEKFGISKDQLAPSLQRIRREASTFNGNVSLETFVETLKKANTDNWSLAKGLTDAQQDAFGSEVRQMLFGIVDDADEGLSDAIVWLKRAREGYHQRASQVTALRRSKVAQALGLDTINPAPEQALASLRDADRGTQALAREILEKHDPQLLQAARQLWWQQTIEDASRFAQSPADAAFDPVVFADEMLSLVGKSDDATAGLFSQADAAQIRQALKDVRAISFGFGGGSRGPDLEAAVRVAGNPLNASSAPFRASLWWRFLGSENFEKRLFTKEGRAQLRELRKLGDSPAFASLIARYSAQEADIVGDPFEE